MPGKRAAVPSDTFRSRALDALAGGADGAARDDETGTGGAAEAGQVAGGGVVAETAQTPAEAGQVAGCGVVAETGQAAGVGAIARMRAAVEAQIRAGREAAQRVRPAMPPAPVDTIAGVTDAPGVAEHAAAPAADGVRLTDRVRQRWGRGMQAVGRLRMPGRAPAAAASGAVAPSAGDATATAGQAAAIRSPLQRVLDDDRARTVSIVALTGASAAMHVALGVQWGVPLFVRNGIGSVALLATHYGAPAAMPQANRYRPLSRAALAGYTGATIAAYFVQRGPLALVDTVGMTTKAVEVGVLGLLWAEHQREHYRRVVSGDAHTVEAFVVEPTSPTLEADPAVPLSVKPVVDAMPLGIPAAAGA
jgi:hypothetical protein